MLRSGIVVGLFIACSTWAQPGAVDLTFVPAIPTNYHVTAACEQENGKLVIGGYMAPVPPAQQNQRGFLIRLQPSGELDSSFRVRWGKDSTYGAINQVFVRKDGNIGALGSLTTIRGRNMHGTAVFGPRGGLHPFYRPQEDASMAGVFHDGSLAYQGVVEVTNEGSRGIFAQLRKLNAWGKKISESGPIMHAGADNSRFRYSHFEWVRALPDGNILAYVGESTVEGGFRDRRYSLYSSAWGQTDVIDTQPYGTAVAGPGNSAYLGGSRAVGYLTRRGAGWAIDPSFAWQFPETTEAPWTIRAIAAQPDGKLVYCAVASAPAVPFTLQRVYRCNDDGSNDSTFDVGHGPNAPVQDFLVLRSGKILAWGPFDDFNGVPVRRIVRLFAN